MSLVYTHVSDHFEMSVHRLLKDNYAYLISSPLTRSCVTIDPSESGSLLSEISQKKMHLEAILCTHHHPDHVGGIDAIKAIHPQAKVYGSEYDLEHKRIPHQTHGLQNSTFSLLGHLWSSVMIPGHTLGALAYNVNNWCFTGDTLFLAGCGRVFEGSMEMMHHSLSLLASMPDETQLFVGHEYYESNLLFAQSIEPENAHIRFALNNLKPVNLPGSLKQEKLHNPFLRATSTEQFAHRRNIKDTWPA